MPDHPEREHLLRDVLWERLREEDSENGKGEKVFIKERCPHYKELLKDVMRQKTAFEHRRDRSIKENERLK